MMCDIWYRSIGHLGLNIWRIEQAEFELYATGIVDFEGTGLLPLFCIDLHLKGTPEEKV